MEQPNFEGLYAIFKGRSTDIDIIKKWEKDFKKALLVNDFYKHDAVKQLFDMLNESIRRNQEALQNQRRNNYEHDNLFFDDRARWEAEINAWNVVISLFSVAQSKADDILKKVKMAEETNKNFK